MANREDQETLRLLVQHVSRAFYDPKFVIVLDQLSRHPLLKDDELAGRIGLQAKELNKLMAVLTNDRLVQVYRQNELKDGAQRSIGKQYYYIDYQHFCNVVKWRVAEMRRRIDSTLRNDLENKGYICPNCKATFTSLEADRLMDFSRGGFYCDICPTSPGGPHEVIMNEDAENIRGSRDRMERFMKQTAFVQEGLKKSEAMILPPFDVTNLIKKHIVDSEKQKQAQSGGLKIAGADGKHVDEGISVLMTVDKDEATRRKEREEEAAAKRQQNLMPSWHLKSTISNDLTSLGIEAQKLQSNGTSMSLGGLKSNADILSGLGKAKHQIKAETVEIVEEAKPVVDHTADFYEQYYASLEAASQAQSASQTPMLDTPIDDFEDRKPNVALLDSLSSPRKRSRSPLDEGRNGLKAARSNAGTPMFSRSPSGVISAEDSPAAPVDMGSFSSNSFPVDDVVIPDVDDPMISVGGKSMPLSQVTDEMGDEMTPEEYQAWYELLMARGQG
ncbi:hypothetical protein SCHPADRAFT_857378 [Schizopora paradoxa]|uniref:HTH TFE/IIEalpha-type domain-containing protein n=1 Tax=Schizopora paradoxa TaxID=27342 RepID=A0A0H2RYH0_9AGAM|nr:hypothetical protein SCHPADRAFT_857378 [Schizopora paradoxa]